MLDAFSALVETETERKRSPLNWCASCAEPRARAAAKIRAEVFMLLRKGRWTQVVSLKRIMLLLISLNYAMSGLRVWASFLLFYLVQLFDPRCFQKPPTRKDIEKATLNSLYHPIVRIFVHRRKIFGQQNKGPFARHKPRLSGCGLVSPQKRGML